MEFSDVLAVSSLTLAILAIGLSLYFYNESSKILMKAHQALAEISQKVAVVVDQSHQYTTQLLDRIPLSAQTKTPGEIAEQEKQQEEQKKAIIEEATKNAMAEIKKVDSGSAEQIQQLEEKLEGIIASSADKSIELERPTYSLNVWASKEAHTIWTYLVHLAEARGMDRGGVHHKPLHHSA